MARSSCQLSGAELDKSKVVELLNRILEAELAGVVRYTHYYSLLVFGFNRSPMVAWLRGDRCAIRPDGHRHHPARIARD